MGVTTMRVNRVRCGDLAISKNKFVATIRVQGPSWVTARQVDLYVNEYSLTPFRYEKGNAGGRNGQGR